MGAIGITSSVVIIDTQWGVGIVIKTFTEAILGVEWPLVTRSATNGNQANDDAVNLRC